MRIIVSDDHPVVLMGVKAVLNGYGGQFDVVAEAHSGSDLLLALASHPCDLLITDFSMPDEGGSDGMPMLKRLRRDYAQLPIIVLTMIQNPALIRGMLALGVNGVVEKGALMKELLLAVQAVMHGRVFLSARLRAQVGETVAGGDAIEDERPIPAENNDALSVREAEVVRLFVSGLTVTQIAERLHRSVKTVSQQKNDAMRKLGLTDSWQLYEYARANGLIT